MWNLIDQLSGVVTLKKDQLCIIYSQKHSNTQRLIAQK